jgi:hypothetical protein
VPSEGWFRAQLDVLMLVTYPGGAKSFDYDDYWEDDALIYTARGKRGDQQLVGPNRDLAENARTNYVFEGSAGAGALRFLRIANTTADWKARGLGDDGVERDIIRYRLEFETGGRDASAGADAAAPSGNGGSSADVHRQRRQFDASRPPSSYSAGAETANAEEKAALSEKANRKHHELLLRLERQLRDRGWTDIVEIPGATDLEASRGEVRALFEAKSISGTNELAQTRTALAQLLEYRYFYGDAADRLCVVTDRPINDRRVRFLNAAGIAVAYDDGSGLVSCGQLANDLLRQDVPRGGRAARAGTASSSGRSRKGRSRNRTAEVTSGRR